MPEFVSGWSDGDVVRLVERGPDGVRIRSVPARWSAFFTDLDDTDRHALQRSGDVVLVEPQGRSTRVDFKNRWARTSVVRRLVDSNYDGRIKRSIREADVNPLRRLLSDHAALQISAHPRVAFFDLETDSRKTFTDATEGRARVLAWALTDASSWSSDPGSRSVIGSAVLAEDTDAAERALLEQFFDAVRDYDVLLAWNGDGFDFPVLSGRADKLRARPSGRAIMWNRWCWLDALEVFKKYHRAADSGDEKVSLRLENVAQATIGVGKNDFDASKTWQEWEAGGERRARMLRYCEQDAVLMPGIEKKTGYVALHVQVCSIVRCFPDSSSLRATQQGDGFLLRLGAEHGYRWPTRFDRDEDEDTRYEGAYVFEPTRTGIVENVHVADFASLYPSIIRTWNISPELEIGPLQDVGPAGACSLPFGGSTRFALDARGMFPLACDTIVPARDVYKKKAEAAEAGSPERAANERLSAAFKIIANSFYGIMGTPFSRFFSRASAEAVTKTGAWLIHHVADRAKERDLTLFYGDSVTGDRVIPVRDPNGWTQHLPIEQLWDRGAEVEERDGKQARFVTGWTALASADGGATSGWFPIVRVIRHRAGKRTWRITTKHGQTQVTPDHGIMVDGREVGPRDFIADMMRFTTIAAMPPERCTTTIRLIDHVGDFVIRREYKGSMTTRRIVVDPQTDELYLDGWGDSSVRIPNTYRVGTAEWRALLRLVGAYVSDGSASIAGDGAVRALLSFCKADFALQNQLAADLRLIVRGAEVFGPYRTGSVYVVRSGTMLISAVFARLCGRGCRDKKLPGFVFDLDSDSFSWMYDALCSGDGHVEDCGQLRFTTTSAQLASGVSYLLSQHGIEHGFAYRESKGAWSIRTRPTGSERARYSIKAEDFDPDPNQWVYDLEVAGAHTFVDGIGRVLLHNTDSVFVQGSSEKFRVLVDDLNAGWSRLLREYGCPRCHIDLDFEKSFRRLVMISKKRYAGRFLWKKGKDYGWDSKPEIKGLEYMRGDSLRPARAMQRELIEMLLSETIPELSDVRAWVERWKVRMLSGELSLDDVTITQSIKDLGEYSRKYTSPRCGAGKGKARCAYSFGSQDIDGPASCPKCGAERKVSQPPVHVRVALQMRDRGLEVRAGTRVAYLIVTSTGQTLDGVPADEPGALERIDRNYYWANRVYPPSLRVLEAAFPAERWQESASETKAREKQETLEARRGRVDDLPLFGTPASPVVDLVRIVVDADVDRFEMADLRAVLEKHRGDVPVRLEMSGAAIDLRRFSVRPTVEMVSDVESVCGMGAVVLGDGN